MKKKLLFILFMCLLFIVTPSFIYAAEATITVINTYNETISDKTGPIKYEAGDCVLINSNGEHLLVDTCQATERQSAAFDYLQKKEIKDVSILISHYHVDHINALRYRFSNDDDIRNAYKEKYNNIKIKKIYLPDPIYLDNYVNNYDGSCAKDRNENDECITTNKTNYFIPIRDNAAIEGIPIQYLWPNKVSNSEVDTINKFYFGDVKVSVLGPIVDENENNTKFRDNNCKRTWGCEYSSILGSPDGHYINDFSIVTMFEIGNVKYLSAGDMESFKSLTDTDACKTYIADSQEESFCNVDKGIADNLKRDYQEEKLVKNKCSELKADILKINHHGRKTSSSQEFLNCVKPKYVFFNHSDYDNEIGSNQKTQVNQIFKDYNTGFNLYSSVQNGTFTFEIKDDKIEMVSETEDNSLFNSKNLKSITVNNSYKNVDSGNKIAGVSDVASKYTYNETLSNTNFLDKDCSDTNICKFNLYLYDYEKNIKGYVLSNSNDNNKAVSIDSNTKTINKEWYYKKVNFEFASSFYYGIDEDNRIIYQVTPALTASSLLSKINTDGNLYIADTNNKQLDSNSKLKTGYKLGAEFNAGNMEYVISVKGDVLGTGELSIENAKEIAEQVIEKRTLSGKEYLLAADYNNDGKIKMNDVIKMLRQIR